MAHIYGKFLLMGFLSFFGGSSSTSSNYSSFVDYFKTKPFGSEPPVMTILSNLPPKDRCGILSELLKSDPTNVNIYDKLSMAYLKNNDMPSALNCLEMGRRSGSLTNQNYSLLKGKIESMNQQFGGRFGSSTNYAEALQGIERNRVQMSNLGEDFSEFIGVINAFCRKQM